MERVGAFFLDRTRAFQLAPPKPHLGRWLQLPKAQRMSLDMLDGYPKNYDQFPFTFEAIDNILRFLSTQPTGLWSDVDFVTRRGIISTLMASGLEERSQTVWATKFNGVIFLSDKEATYARRMEEWERVLDYKGRKFESLVFPGQNGVQDEMISNAAGFHIVYKTQLAGHTLMYNAEIDGVLDGEETELKDLRLGEAKLKLGRGNFSAVRECKMWAQSFLSGVEKMVIGTGVKGQYLTGIELKDVEEIRPKNYMDRIANLEKILGMIKALVTEDDPDTIYEVTVSKDDVAVSLLSTERSFLEKNFVRKVLKQR